MMGFTSDLALSDALAFVRLLVLTGYLLPVVYQAKQELHNYKSGVTSTAMSTQRDANVSSPAVAVCMRRPFKGSSLILEKAEFLNRTYAVDEVLDLKSQNLTVQPVYTRFLGTCYLLTATEGSKKFGFLRIAVSNPRLVKLFLLTEAQEFCLQVGICHVRFPIILPSSDSTEIWLTTTMKKWPEDSCNADQSYNQYRCMADYVRNRTRDLPCYTPAHELAFFDNTTTTSKACGSREELLASVSKLSKLFNGLVTDTDSTGCRPSCVTWSYSEQVTGYDNDQLRNFAPLLPNGNVFVKILSTHIQVLKEYAVYDLNRLVGNIGGSLGLFVGFSFFDCTAILLNKVASSVAAAAANWREPK